MSSPIIDKSTAKITQADYDFVFSLSDGESCYRLSNQDIALIMAHLEMMSWHTRWYRRNGEISQPEKEGITDFVGTLANKLLTPVDCEKKGDEQANSGESVPQASMGIISELQSRINELEEEIEMACKCPELKFINGVLNESYVDDCGCKKWRPVPTEGSNTGGINGSLGASLGGALLDSQGKAKPDSRLNIPPVELDQRNYEIEACAKATALVDIVLSTMNALVEGKSQWDNLGDAVGLPLGTWSAAMSNFFVATVPALAPAAIPVAIANLAKNLTSPIRDEITDKLAEPSLRETLICEQANAMIRDADVFGEELESILDSLLLGATAYTAVSLALQVWDLQQITEILRTAVNGNDCGCPQLVQQQSYSPLAPPYKPSAAIWSVEADLKSAQHGTRLFDVNDPGNGAYVQGVGYINSSYPYEDVPDATQFTRILIDWQSLTGRILRVDWLAENVVEGLFQSNTGTPNADIEKFLVYVSADQQPTQYVDNGSGWRVASFGHTFANINLWWLWGYCEIGSAQGGQSSPGQGTITKIRIHGTGTKPAWFASNGWVDV